MRLDRMKSCHSLQGCSASGGIRAMNEEKLAKEFQDFAMQAAEFSRRVSDRNPDGESSRCIEIFVILYNLGPVGFEDLRRRLGVISPRVLSQKLKTMESGRLVRRTLIDSRPPGVRYSLTEKGVTVARLGTPVFLFLNLDKQPA